MFTSLFKVITKKCDMTIKQTISVKHFHNDVYQNTENVFKIHVITEKFYIAIYIDTELLSNPKFKHKEVSCSKPY